MAPRILVVDDDRHIADTLKTILESVGYDCVVSYSAADALETVELVKPVLVISDVVMPGMTGIELVLQLRARDPHLRIILLSGNAATEELLAQAGETVGPVTVIAKPCSPRELIRVVGEKTSQIGSAD